MSLPIGFHSKGEGRGGGGGVKASGLQAQQVTLWS